MENAENFKYLADGMKEPPKNLQNLTLYLKFNYLGAKDI